MLKIVPLIIISSTISMNEPKTFTFPADYSMEAYEFMQKNKIKDSQDTSNILYDLIQKELLENDG